MKFLILYGTDLDRLFQAINHYSHILDQGQTDNPEWKELYEECNELMQIILDNIAEE